MGMLTSFISRPRDPSVDWQLCNVQWVTWSANNRSTFFNGRTCRAKYSRISQVYLDSHLTSGGESYRSIVTTAKKCPHSEFSVSISATGISLQRTAVVQVCWSISLVHTERRRRQVSSSSRSVQFVSFHCTWLSRRVARFVRFVGWSLLSASSVAAETPSALDTFRGR